jgi:hypothetical protein
MTEHYSINTPDGKTITKNSKVNYTHAIIASGSRFRKWLNTSTPFIEDDWGGYLVLSAHKTRAAAEKGLATLKGRLNSGEGWYNLTLVEVNNSLPYPGEITKNLFWRMMQAIRNPEKMTRQQSEWLAADAHTAYVVNWPDEEERLNE